MAGHGWLCNCYRCQRMPDCYTPRGMSRNFFALVIAISVVVFSVDIYQTIGDAEEIHLADHITLTEGEPNSDGSAIDIRFGLDIPEMGYLDKSIMVKVNFRVIDSDPITEGEYSFEYKLGEGERIYDYVLKDLDSVTASKAKSGEPIDIEYSGTIMVEYLGFDIPQTTQDIPLDTFTVNE